jgi:hypothetical protein
MVTAALAFLSSCGDDGDDTDPVVAPDIAYSDTEAALGAEKKVGAANQGDAATFEITDDDGTEDFVSINASTGELTIAAESVIGEYELTILATNAAGTDEATAKITVGISEDFDPRGKKFLWTYFINQGDLTLTGLQGELLGDLMLPVNELQVPIGWPTAETPQEDYWQYFLMTELEKLIFQVPGDEACGAAGGNGDTLAFVVNQDLTLSALCNGDIDPAVIGQSTISYADGGFVFTLLLKFDEQITLPYAIGNATFADFTDPLTQQTFPALQGRVAAFTTPTDLTSEETVLNIATWATPPVDVVLEVLPD